MARDLLNDDPNAPSRARSERARTGMILAAVALLALGLAVLTARPRPAPRPAASYVLPVEIIDDTTEQATPQPSAAEAAGERAPSR